MFYSFNFSGNRLKLLTEPENNDLTAFSIASEKRKI
jgi:hypothetical protein